MTVLLAEYNTTLSKATRDASKLRRRKSSISDWKRVRDCAIARHDATLVPVNLNLNVGVDAAADDTLQGVLVVGGQSNDRATIHEVEFFNSNKREWSQPPPMSTPRLGCAVATMGSNVYVFGGLEAAPQENTCESLSIMDNTWSKEKGLNSPRWFGAAVSFPLHEDIIVLGGRDDQFQELATVESYDTTTKEWLPLSSMSTPRFGCGAARIAPSKLMVVGGFDGDSWQTSVECFDYETNEWSGLKAMPEALEFCKANPLDQNHVLVSGHGQDKDTKVYVYNIAKDYWGRLRLGKKIRHASAVAPLGSSDLLILDASKKTSIVANVLRHQDEVTEASSQTSDSMLEHDDDIVDQQAFAADTTPWWASPTPGMERPSVIIPQQELDHISLLPDDDDFTHASLDIPESSTRSNSMGRRNSNHSAKRRGSTVSVNKIESMDSEGQRVLFTGRVSNVHGRPSGKGVMKWIESGDTYKGHFHRGQKHGEGLLLYSNGDTFTGNFQKDKREGKGTFYRAKDGRQYDGMYVNDQPHDEQGKMAWSNGTTYVGSFSQGSRTGKAVQCFASGVRYEGDFVDGKYDGMGTCVFTDETVYEGSWSKGKAHGYGCLRDASKKVLYDGNWKNDSPTFEA